MDQFVIGVDVGGTNTRIGFFDMEGRLLMKHCIPTRLQESGAQILLDICRLIRGEFGEKDKPAGVGIGVPGPVTKDGRVLGCVNLGWGTFDIEKQLSNILGGVPVKAGNDASLAAFGEFRMGAGKACSDMVLITLGTGIGSGIIIDGTLLTGYNGAAGEIGHLPLVTDCNDLCTCGKTGCLELAASATGIVRQAYRLLAETNQESGLRQIEKITAKDVIDLAKAKDQLAISVVDRAMEYLGAGLACVASVVNPGLFLIGGGVSGAGDFLIEILEQKFRKKAFTPCENVKIELASLGSDAGIYGAAAGVIRMLKEE